MNARKGIGRIILVLHLSSWIWFVFCGIEIFEKAGFAILSALKFSEPSWAMLILFFPTFKLIGICLAGVIAFQTIIWILMGFVDE